MAANATKQGCVRPIGSWLAVQPGRWPSFPAPPGCSARSLLTAPPTPRPTAHAMSAICTLPDRRTARIARCVAPVGHRRHGLHLVFVTPRCDAVCCLSDSTHHPKPPFSAPSIPPTARTWLRIAAAARCVKVGGTRTAQAAATR